MGFFTRKENRAQSEKTAEDVILKAFFGGSEVTREMALQVPAVVGGIGLIADIIAGTPVKLYREGSKETEEITNDPRIRLLNDDPGDTLTANEMWRALVADYYLGKGGYLYIRKENARPKSLHYVREDQISVMTVGNDPIIKDYEILVAGHPYKPYEFVRILRNTKDGAKGTPITEENSVLIALAYYSLKFELNLVKKGGNKRGFLKSQKPLTEDKMQKLKKAFRDLYSNSDEAVVVLNEGIDFKESSSTSVELQLREQKITNAEEFAKIFHISTDAMGGKANEDDVASIARLAAIPLMKTIESALNRNLLLETEKKDHYWAFDVKELLKGDMASRFAAYKTALDARFMQVDEVRFAEDMPPLGMDWVRLNLGDVLYDPKTKTIYTPNTNARTPLDAKRLPGAEKEEPE